MRPDLSTVLPRLKHDVSKTLGDTFERLIDETAADIRELDIAGGSEKLVNDVQQHFHDTHVHALWPACPLHATHPLWYRDGAWWCVEGGVAVAPLGELVPSA